MISWNHMIVLLSALLLVFLIWKEWNAGRAGLIWRIAASVLAVLSLAGLVLQLLKEDLATGKMAVLLTEGFNRDSLNKFLSVNDSKPRFVSLPELLTDSLSHYDSLHIFGYGLDAEELDELKQTHFTFHPSVLPSEITSIHWNELLGQGEALTVNGTLNAPSKPVSMKLSLLGLTVDSTVIEAGRSQEFHLKTIPQFIGSSNYDLLLLSGEDTIEKEIVPVECSGPDTLNILSLSSSPGFEDKFKLRWFESRGDRIYGRTQISRNKFSNSFINNDSLKRGLIWKDQLNNTDLVLADIPFLLSLSENQLGLLRQAIIENGLGLLIQADSAISPRLFFSKWFPIKAAGDSVQENLKLLNIRDSGKVALFAKNPATISYRPGTRPLLTDERGRIFVSAIGLGVGRIVCVTLNNSYKWVLSGNKDYYSSFWSLCAREARTRAAASQLFQFADPLPIARQPVFIRLVKQGTSIPQIEVNGTKLNPVEDIVLPAFWKGTYWPAESGWHTISEKEGAKLLFYVFGESDWKSVVAARKTELTLRASWNNRSAIKTKSAGNTEPIWPPWLLFLIFMISTTYLWVVQKRS